MVSIDDIIDKLGGPDAAAKRTGVGLEAVRKWRQARAIPPKHWSTIMAATGLPVEALSDTPGEQTAAPPGAPATVPPASLGLTALTPRPASERSASTPA